MEQRAALFDGILRNGFLCVKVNNMCATDWKKLPEEIPARHLLNSGQGLHGGVCSFVAVGSYGS